MQAALRQQLGKAEEDNAELRQQLESAEKDREEMQALLTALAENAMSAAKRDPLNSEYHFEAKVSFGARLHGP